MTPLSFPPPCSIQPPSTCDPGLRARRLQRLSACLRTACVRARALAGESLSRDPAPRAPRGYLRGTVFPALGLSSPTRSRGEHAGLSESREERGRAAVAYVSSLSCTHPPVLGARSPRLCSLGATLKCGGACDWGRSQGPGYRRLGLASRMFCDLGLATLPEFSHLCSDFDEDANACFACSRGVDARRSQSDRRSMLYDG